MAVFLWIMTCLLDCRAVSESAAECGVVLGYEPNVIQWVLLPQYLPRIENTDAPVSYGVLQGIRELRKSH